MKQSDAKKLGKATEALLKRLRACQTTLKAREKTVLSALDSVFECNDAISAEFEKWDEISHELDEDAEIAPVMVDPKLDLDALIVDAAFESVHLALDTAIESFEGILKSANEYEEPEEEEDESDVDEGEEDKDDDEEEEDEHLCACDHPGCLAESPARRTAEAADQAARTAGWSIGDEGTYCPEHIPAPETEGEHFGCHARACYAESPGCETLDEAEEAALAAGWKFDPKGWPYCPKHRDQA